MVSEAKKASNAAWDKDNLVYQTVKVRKEILEEFKAAVKARGDKVNTVLRDAMVSYSSNVPQTGPAPAGLGLPDEAMATARNAAEAAGEELGVFLARAIKDTADRDEQIRRLIPAKKPEPKQEPKEEELEPRPSFAEQAQAIQEKWKQHNYG